MTNPYGPQDQSTNDDETSHPETHRTRSGGNWVRAGDENPGIWVRDPEFHDPREGVQVRYIGENGDGDKTDIVKTLPAVLGLYMNGDDPTIQVAPQQKGDRPKAIALADLDSVKTWNALRIPVSRTRADMYARAYVQVASAMPLVPQSPTVLEGWPPLAPDTLTPTTENPEDARVAWGTIADHLTPVGRFVVGAALGSPWIGPQADTPVLLSLVGETGHGKTMLARVCAALYGPSEENKGLARVFNSTKQGIPTYSMDLSYLPVILDESNAKSGDLSSQMSQLLSGSARLSATRSGSSRLSTGQWKGTAIVTGNKPLAPALSDPSYSRRMIEIDLREHPLWFQPDDSDIDRATRWWGAIHNWLLPAMEGWPWHELARHYPPGPKAAGFGDRVQRHPSPGPSSLGLFGRLSYTACEWLAEWTGNRLWTKNVWDTIRSLVAIRLVDKYDTARDAAEAIIDHKASNPGVWGDKSDFQRELVAYQYPVDQPCRTGHGGDCQWWAMPTKTVERITEEGIRALTALPKFTNALCESDETEHRWTPKVSANGTRFRAVVMCTEGLSDVAWNDVEVVLRDSAPAAAPEPTAPEPDPVEEGPITYGWTCDTDVATALDKAVADGVTYLVGPMTLRDWTPQDIEDAGWDTYGWLGNGAGRVSKDGRSLRVARADDPEAYVAMLEDWRDRTGRPVVTTIPRLGHDLLREFNEGRKELRWQPKGPIRRVFSDEDRTRVATPAQWKADEVPGDAESWDRNKSFLPSITQAIIAPLYYGEDFVHHYGDAVPEPSSRTAGMWHIVVPNSIDSRLPLPVGTSGKPGDELWVSTDIMRFYTEELDIHPEVIEAVVAPAHRDQTFRNWSKQITDWLDEFDGTPAGRVPKMMYQSFAGRFAMAEGEGRRNAIYRPDWGRAIADNSWLSIMRHVYRNARDHGLYPVRVNVDAIYYPRGSTPDLPMGTGLGQFKKED